MAQSFDQEKQDLLTKIQNLNRDLAAKDTEIKSKQDHANALAKERDELAKDYFEILDENAALSDKIQALQKKSR